MTGRIIPFPGCGVPPHAPPMMHLPVPFTTPWQREHLPLVDQAMELLHADEAELQRRCREMAGRGGPSLLARLATQIDNLGSHIGDVAIALSLTALRIRHTMKTLPA